MHVNLGRQDLRRRLRDHGGSFKPSCKMLWRGCEFWCLSAIFLQAGKTGRTIQIPSATRIQQGRRIDPRNIGTPGSFARRSGSNACELKDLASRETPRRRGNARLNWRCRTLKSGVSPNRVNAACFAVLETIDDDREFRIHWIFDPSIRCGRRAAAASPSAAVYRKAAGAWARRGNRTTWQP